MSGSNAGAFPQAALEGNYSRQRAAESHVRTTAGGHNPFADLIIDERASHRRKRAASVGLALTIQTVVVGARRIFSGMKEPALIYAPPVVYPAIAKQAHVSGTVVIEAVIDDKGNVTQVKAISGPALLMPAALRAVSERKYQPTFLDGIPVSIRFDVKVQFNRG